MVSEIRIEISHINWCTFGALIGAWRFKDWSVVGIQVEVVRVDLDILNA